MKFGILKKVRVCCLKDMNSYYFNCCAEQARIVHILKQEKIAYNPNSL